MIEGIISYLNEVSGNQPMIVSAIMLPITSALAYLAKDIPLKVWAWAKSQFVSTVVVSTGSSYQDKAYHATLKMIEPHSIDWLRRISNLVAPIWGNGAQITAGFGSSYYWINGKFVGVNKRKVENVDGGYEGKVHETATIWWTGRSHWFTDMALGHVNETLSADNKDDTKTRYLRVDDTWSDYTAEVDKLTLDDLALDPTLKDQLRTKVHQFKNGKEVYANIGIAHKLAILLHGIPGTGKTALIRAIAGELDYDIAIGLDALIRLKMQGRKRVVVALDDIDSAYAIAKRKNVEKNETIKKNEGKTVDSSASSNSVIVAESDVSNYSLAALLNAMDGVVPLNEICIILSTNDLSNIDEAVTRDARIDLNLEVCAVPSDTVRNHFTDLYGPLPEVAVWPDMLGSSIYQIKERALTDRDIVVKLVNHYIEFGSVNTAL